MLAIAVHLTEITIEIGAYKVYYMPLCSTSNLNGL